MVENKLQLFFFSALLLGILIISVIIFLPYAIPIAIAATFSVIFYPIYQRVKRVLKANEGLAALITIIIALLIALVPITFFGVLIVNEAYGLYASFTQGTIQIQNPLSFLQNLIGQTFPQLSLDLNIYIRLGLEWIVQHLGSIFTRVVATALNFFLGVIAFYYFLKDGGRLTRAIIKLSPLPDKYDEEILRRLARTVNSVVKGSLTISVIQGIQTGIGLAIFGVPNPALWGGVAALTALIPGVGTSLVIVPAIAFLFLTGKTAAAIGLLVWGATAVGLVDNFLGPRLVSKGVKIHPFLILISVLGGLRFFGIVGFLLGPLVLSLLFSLLAIYSELVNETT